MKLLNKIFAVPAVAFLLLLTSAESFGQTAPNISYSPVSSQASPISLTAGVAMTAMTPGNSGGSVSGVAYGTAILVGSSSGTNGSLNLPY
ncbi:MAG: hypothetical protein JSU01_13395, partial [Bacteroidetes bacterium]|nr:hypothetical protein [Bacteroidota bacterium]